MDRETLRSPERRSGERKGCQVSGWGYHPRVLDNALLPRAADHVVSTRFDGGEGVLVDLNAKRYYTLNETALVVWLALEEGTDMDTVVRRLTETYDVDAAHARRSVETVLEDLRQLQLLA